MAMYRNAAVTPFFLAYQCHFLSLGVGGCGKLMTEKRRATLKNFYENDIFFTSYHDPYMVTPSEINTRST
jgi:hypothetical protein